ncbi:MAG: hypothetical protein EOP50_02265, partial [Sphingobacteriales bacterium]
ENQPGFCSNTGEIGSTHSGFTGPGYVDGLNQTGVAVVWAVNVAAAGTYQISLRYANAAEARPATLKTDSNEVANFNFDSTTAWTQWQAETRNIYLEAGNNLLSLDAQSANGLANIDAATIYAAGNSAVKPAAGQCSTAPTSGAIFPSHNAINVNPDTRLRINFDNKPSIKTGEVQIYDAATNTLVDTIKVTRDTDVLGYSGQTATRTLNVVPAQIIGNAIFISPHTNRLQYGKKYSVVIANGVFTGAQGGRAFTGFSAGQWQFITKSTGPSGTTNGGDATFVSPAARPSAPTAANETVTTADVTLNADGNPAGTEYAIYETTTGLYVQANGSLAASAVWATMATWATKTVTGLSGGTTYNFQAIARNSAGKLTGNSASGTVTTMNGNSIAINGASFAASYCNAANNSFNVSFTPGGTFTGTFKVQVSNASGVFAANTTDNIIGTGTGSPIMVTIPAGFAAGTGYRFRVVNDAPEFFGTDNGANVTIVQSAAPAVSISANPGTTICTGTSVTFTANPTDGGTPTYQWKKNNTNVGTNSATYTDAALLNGDVISVTMTSSIACVTSATATAQVTMVVNTTPAPPTPTVTIGCGTASLDAMADPGAPLVYYWQGKTANGTKTDSLATDAYMVTSNGTYYVRAYNSSTGCWSTTSTSVLVIIPVAATVNTQPVNTTSYDGSTSGFTATASNSTAVKWQVNTGAGFTDIANNSVYSWATSNTLTIAALTLQMTGFQYRAVFSSNTPCPDVTSNTATLTVLPSPVVVFTENVGTGTASGTNQGVNTYTGWQNQGTLSFSGSIISGTGGSLQQADVRTSTPSTTAPSYSGASGVSNVFFGTASGVNNRSFVISNINTTNLVDLKLSFGILRDNISNELTLEVSSDNVNWTPLTYTSPAANTWTYITASGSIPSTSNLRIRFSKNSGTSFRLDDIKLVGYRPDPVTTSIAPSSGTQGDPAFTLTVNGSDFMNNSAITWNGSANGLTTTFVSSTQLTAVIPANRLANTGTATVGVTTPNALNNSNTQTFTINPRSITLNSISNNSFCNGSANTLNVAFSAQGTFNSPFYVQLSDASGNFPNNTTDNIISSASNTSPISATIPQGLAAGTYKVRVLNANLEVYSGASAAITVDQSGAATLSYPGSPYCTSEGTGTVFFSGTNGGTFSASPAGLVIDAQTGAIDIAASAAGTYTVTYSFNGGTACASSASTQVSIRPATLVEPVGNPVYCAGSTTVPVNFSGAAGLTYNWTNSNGSIGLATS